MISGVGGVVTLKENELYDKVTDSKRLRASSTTDVSVEIVDCYVIVWYSVEIISTVAHLAQTLSSHGFTSIVRKKDMLSVYNNYCYNTN